MPSLTSTPTDCLLIIDVQNDFCSGGALEVPSGDEVVPLINRLTNRFSHRILTQDWHPSGHLSFASSHTEVSPLQTIELDYGTQVLWPEHCVQGTRGAEFHPGLETRNCELILRKGFRHTIDSYSAFFENDKTTVTGLSGYLRARGLDRLYLVGLALDFCVLYSALDGRREGFAVNVIEDACRAIDFNSSLADAQRQMDQAGAIRIQSTDLDF
jgi:nicotinamidase/pyrazinamidase